MEEITYEESLQLGKPLYIDVRAPVEYEEDHVYGAVNLPIFNNDERKEVGTLYMMAGREDAVKRGTEIGGKNVGVIINSVMEYRDRSIVIYCARGGMRSASVAALMNSLGIPVYRLKEGYKSYRRYINRKLASTVIKPCVFVLQGFTGAGKTEILGHIKNSVDLEFMAGHRSSVFGAIGMHQKSQKYFETQLYHRLLELEKEDYVIFEGESRKIGDLHIPDSIFAQLRSAPVIYIDTSIERRVEIIRKEYTKTGEVENVPDIVSSLKNRLGTARVTELTELYREGRIGEFIEILLRDYYDKLYRHTFDEFEYIAVIKNEESEKAAKDVVAAVERHLSLDSMK